MKAVSLNGSLYSYNYTVSAKYNESLVVHSFSGSDNENPDGWARNAVSISQMIKSNPATSTLLKMCQQVMEQGNLEKDTGILPPGVLAITKNYIIYERPPEVKTIFLVDKLAQDIDDDMAESEARAYALPLPWQLYIITYSSSPSYNNQEDIDLYASDVYMFFMKNNLHSFDQEIFLAPLPNFYTNGSLCRPMLDTMEDIDRYSKDISGVIQAAYEWIWNGGTNLDLTESVCQMYSQYKYVDATNTVWKKPKPNGSLSMESYYCNSAYVKELFTYWENTSLENICEMNWPANSYERNFHLETRTIDPSLIEEYAKKHGLTPFFEYHYDDDDDNEGYQCDDEDCDCRTPQYSVDLDRVRFEYNIFPPKPFNVQKVIEKICNSYNYGGVFGAMMRDRTTPEIINGLIRDIIISS